MQHSHLRSTYHCLLLLVVKRRRHRSVVLHCIPHTHTPTARVSWRTESPAPLHDARTRSPGAEPSLPPPPPPTAAKHSILPRAPPEVRACRGQSDLGGTKGGGQ
ncbi:hypothetical protein DPSP01_014750 [Paraphaeosphaeria sporulosa]